MWAARVLPEGHSRLLAASTAREREEILLEVVQERKSVSAQWLTKHPNFEEKNNKWRNQPARIQKSLQYGKRRKAATATKTPPQRGNLKAEDVLGCFPITGRHTSCCYSYVKVLACKFSKCVAINKLFKIRSFDADSLL